MRILITGASGFLGQCLSRRFVDQGHYVVAAGRHPVSQCHEFVNLPEIVSVDWRPLVQDADCIIHLAAIAHTRGYDEEQLRNVNRDAAVRLAEVISAQQKFIFMSSIRAQGEGDGRVVLDEQMSAAPTCDYGRMKRSAEVEIERINPNACILRPVTIYGAGAKAGMRLLSNLLESPWPLPFSGLHAERSYVSSETVAAATSFIMTNSLRGIYNLADPEPVSLSQFAHWYRSAQGRADHLFRLPEHILVGSAAILGLEEFAKLAVKPMHVTSQKLRDAGFSFPFESSQQSIEAWARLPS